MAKPGSGDARRIANGHGGVNLEAAALSDEHAQAVQEQLELAGGLRCQGCGRRIGIGFHFTSIDPRDVAQGAVMKLAACSRGDCGMAELARDGATLMEMVEYVWLDANGPDAPASPHAKFFREWEEAQGGDESSS